jgi:hypothetical protein
MALSSMAVSITERAIGPVVSWVALIGTTPRREINATVGRKPTSPLSDEGQMIEPVVSEPTVAAAKLAAVATPEPELEPQVERVRS